MLELCFLSLFFSWKFYFSKIPLSSDMMESSPSLLILFSLVKSLTAFTQSSLFLTVNFLLL